MRVHGRLLLIVLSATPPPLTTPPPTTYTIYDSATTTTTTTNARRTDIYMYGGGGATFTPISPHRHPHHVKTLNYMRSGRGGEQPPPPLPLRMTERAMGSGVRKACVAAAAAAPFPACKTEASRRCRRLTRALQQKNNRAAPTVPNNHSLCDNIRSV